jgi:hypothetical protein
LIPESTYQTWFVDHPNPSFNINRCSVDLELQTLPLRLVKKFCQDGPQTPHASGNVYKEFSSYYSLEALEGMQLWENLKAKADSYGGCPALGY